MVKKLRPGLITGAAKVEEQQADPRAISFKDGSDRASANFIRRIKIDT